MDIKIVVALIGLTGAVIGAVITVAGQFVGVKIEEKKKKIKAIANQYASFYELEKLYLEEIEKLRQGEKTSGNGKAADGIKREFRKKNEENGNPKISETSRSIKKFLDEF